MYFAREFAYIAIVQETKALAGVPNLWDLMPDDLRQS